MEPADSAVVIDALPPVVAPPPANVITREALNSGTYLAMIREKMPKSNPTLIIHSDEQLRQTQRAFLDSEPRQKDLWVFAYGSLMWNPAINFREQRVGVLKGYSRRLNLWMKGGRGTPERPGLMLGLEKGGLTEGVALLLPSETAEYELSLVWQREMFTTIYIPQWVDVETEKGTIRAVTVISNIEHEQYAGEMPDDKVASIVASASGVLGSNADYLSQTVDSIISLGLHDSSLQRLQELVSKNQSIF